MWVIGWSIIAGRLGWVIIERGIIIISKVMIYLLPGDDLQLESRESIKKSSKVSGSLSRHNRKLKSTPSKRIWGSSKEQHSSSQRGSPSSAELSSSL